MSKFYVQEKTTYERIDLWEFDDTSETSLKKKLKNSFYQEGSKLDSTGIQAIKSKIIIYKRKPNFLEGE